MTKFARTYLAASISKLVGAPLRHFMILNLLLLSNTWLTASAESCPVSAACSTSLIKPFENVVNAMPTEADNNLFHYAQYVPEKTSYKIADASIDNTFLGLLWCVAIDSGEKQQLLGSVKALFLCNPTLSLFSDCAVKKRLVFFVHVTRNDYQMPHRVQPIDLGSQDRTGRPSPHLFERAYSQGCIAGCKYGMEAKKSAKSEHDRGSKLPLTEKDGTRKVWHSPMQYGFEDGWDYCFDHDQLQSQSHAEFCQYGVGGGRASSTSPPPH